MTPQSLFQIAHGGGQTIPFWQPNPRARTQTLQSEGEDSHTLLTSSKAIVLVLYVNFFLMVSQSSFDIDLSTLYSDFNIYMHNEISSILN